MTTKSEKMWASTVLRSLCGPKGPLGPPAHASLYEVANSTGFAANRFADAIVVSCWPSRGLWFGGLEVKVSRTDWLRELKDPAKSHAIQKWCSYWWVATAEGVVREGEVPETWGWYEVNSKGKSKLRKAAPQLTPEPPSVAFVASLLRNAANATEAVAQQAADAAVLAERAENNAGKHAEERSELIARVNRAEQALYYAKRERDELRVLIEEFERGVGGGFHLNRHASTARREGQLFALASQLEHTNIGRIADVLEAVVKTMREAAAELPTALDPRSLAARM